MNHIYIETPAINTAAFIIVVPLYAGGCMGASVGGINVKRPVGSGT
jgi:hypothetical protein